MRAGFHQAAGALSASAATLLHESQGVQEEVTEVLVTMQYHDRVTQILNHVQGDIERFRRLFDGRCAERSSGLLPDAVDAEQWLAQMERGYTTSEQIENHRGGHGQFPQTSDDVTFF